VNDSAGLRVRRDGTVLRVTIDRPVRRNAFDADLIEAMTLAFADVGDARVVVLEAEGPSFTAGADVGWMQASIDLGHDENIADARRFRAMFAAVDECTAPVVAGIRGFALGVGCGLAACCDVVVASRDAVFAVSEVKLGIVPAVVSPFLLARIGTGAARRLFVTGERFDAETALRIGLVHEIAPDLEAAVARVVEEILQGGPEATRVAKQLAKAPQRADETIALIAERRASAEGQEGLRAFLERREPTWRADS
jgi:enoyl-CoA hydratase/carnithine racemase